MGSRISRLLGVATVAVLAVAMASPAQGAGQGHGTYYQPPTKYFDSGDFDPECKGLDLSVHFWVKGVFSTRNVPGSGGQAFLLRDHYKFKEVWSDASGDVVFTDRGRYLFKEVSAKRVKKSDVPRRLIPPGGLIGPIYEFRAIEDGWDIVRDSDGDSLYRTRGRVVYKGLFDLLGDHQPSATLLDFEIVKVEGPHPLLERDLCEVAAEQLE